jgi:hypothetical protein
VFNFSATDLNTGKYSTWFILTSTGSYGVEIKRAGVHISGSPYLIQVAVAPLDPAMTLIKGAGINGGVISRTNTFRAKLYDSYGNPQVDGGAQVQVVLSDKRLTTIPAVKELGNGEVQVSYMGVVLGSFGITVIVNNISVPGSPFPAKIVLQAGAPSPDTSLIVGPEPIILTAGTSGLVVLELRDGIGLKIDTGDHLSSFYAAWIAVPGIELANPVKEGQPNQDGTYNILLSSSITRSGSYGLQVFVQMKQIQASPFNVTVSASDVYAPACRPLPMALGEMYTLATAGVTGQFLVEIRDFYGNAIENDPRSDIGFEATMSGVAGSKVDVFGLTQGFKEVGFTATRAGTYQMTVTVAEIEISGVPFEITVLPARFYPPGSSAVTSTFTNAVVGRILPFELESTDRFGNVVDTKGAAVEAVATGDSRYISEGELARIQPVLGQLKYSGAGKYTGTVSFTRSANYVLGLSFDGEHVKGSPFSLFIGPGEANETFSSISGIGTRNAITDEIATFVILARDNLWNPITSGGLTFATSLYPATCTTPCSIQSPADVFDEGNGKYLGFYTITTPGRYLLEIKCRTTHLSGSPFSVDVAVPFPPIPTVGKFLESGSYLSILFDVATDFGNVKTEAACDNLLVDPRLSLGKGCTLFWYNPRELYVRLGAEATILPGEEVKLAKDKIRNKKSTSSFSAGSVRMNRPDVAAKPTAIIEGPSQIGACDLLTLDARSSTGSAGRNLRFRWGVAPGGLSEETIFDAIRAANANTACPAWALTGECHASSISIDASLMDTGVTYQFNLEATNMFGEKSTAQHAVARLEDGVPMIYVEGGPLVQANPTSDLHLSVAVKASKCGSANPSYAWSAVSASDGVMPAITKSLTRRLYIPKNTLRAGIDFVYKTSAESSINGRTFVVTSDLLIRVNRLSLFARIYGGSRAISVSDSAELRVEILGNAESLPSRTVQWGCEPFPCFTNGDLTLLVDSETITIPPGTLVPGPYKFSATVSAQFGDTYFTSSAYVVIYVTPAAQPRAQAKMPAAQYQDSKADIALEGKPESFTDPTFLFEWRQLRGGDAFDPAKMMTLSAQFGDTMLFRSKALMEGASYRFRLEIKSAGGVGFAEVDMLINAAPSGGYFTVFPPSGFAVDTDFQLEAGSWTDVLDNLPLTYIYTYVLDVEPDSLEVNSVPIAETSRQYTSAILPNVNKPVRNASFGVRIVNMGRCDVRRTIIVRVSEPRDPQASAALMRAKIDTAAGLGDMESVLALSTCLSSLLDTSLAQRRINTGCTNDGTNCDNDDLRLYLTSKIGQSLSGVVPTENEAAMFANSIYRAGSAFANRTTQDSCLQLTKRVLAHALRGSGLSQEAMDSTTGTYSDLLQASLDKSTEAAIQHNENISIQITDLVDNMTSYQLQNMFVGQNPRVSANNNVQLLVARTRLLGANWSLPNTILEMKRRSDATKKRIELSMPANGLPAPASVGLTAVDLAAVQWGTDVHPRAQKPIGSDTLTLNLTTHYQNGSTLRQERLEAPVRITFAQEATPRATRGADVFDRCNYWDPQKRSYQSKGAIVDKISYQHVTCEAFHMTDFASVLFKSLGDIDDILTVNEANPFMRWTPDRILAFAVCWLLLSVYWAACWFARRHDKRALADLSQQIKYRDEGDAYKTAKSKEEEMRARDYVMIKAILKHRMATRYKSWRVQTLQLLKTEHVFGGIIWRPVFSSFTRPRRITCLFVIFIGNLTLNILFLGRGGFDLTARIAAGITSAIIMFPIGVIFVMLFKSIDSETTWKMHRRRRVRRVQESVAVRGAIDILGKKTPQADSKTRGETFVPYPPMPPAAPIKGAPGGPPPPKGARPEFVRKASPKDMEKRVSLETAPPPPPPGGMSAAKSLRRRLADQGGYDSMESSRSTSAASSIPPPPSKAMIGTEMFVRRNEALRGPAVSGKAANDTGNAPAPPPPPGKSNRPPPPPMPGAGEGQGAGFFRRTSVRDSSEEKATKQDIDFKPQAAPPPLPPPRNVPPPPAGVNPRPAVPNAEAGSYSRRSRAGGEDQRSRNMRGGVPAPPVIISVRPPVPQNFKPVNMMAAMQPGQSAARMRNSMPQSMQQSFVPPPPPGQSSYPSLRRTSRAPPPPPPR